MVFSCIVSNTFLNKLQFFLMIRMVDDTLGSHLVTKTHPISSEGRDDPVRKLVRIERQRGEVFTHPTNRDRDSNCHRDNHPQ